MSQSQYNNFDVIVVGGGASGMMAAGRAAELGKKVLLLEKNKELANKLKITGGGRCNITNAEYDIRALLKNYGAAEQFLYSSFSQFGVKETFTYFEERGLPLVIQARKRAFPHTEKALDVFKVLEKELVKNNVTIKLGATVSKVLKEEGKISGIQVGRDVYTATSYILATGGASHPETGSTGDGFGWLGNLGHKVKAPTPTIVPIKVSDTWAKALSGVAINSMKITFYVDGVKKFTKTGKILFTHFGLSGPLILNSAGKVGDLLQEGLVTAKIDLYPDLDDAKLEKKILKVFDENKNKMLKNIFAELVPPGTAAVILSLLKDPEVQNTKVHSVSRDARRNILVTLRTLPLSITGLMGFERAVVADGGVDLAEIDTKTMRSKKYDNLFITGDLLHINRPSGGFSLQLCWTTGHVAGSHA
ncbi:MAG: aminoacetone oxidase family FAD-binding enzyme [bacterium]